MNVVRLAVFEEGTELQEDDERRAASLRELVRSQPGFLTGYHLRHPESGRMMSFTVWQSDEAMERAEQAVAQRPAEDQRRIRPTTVERWVVDGSF